MHRMGQKAVGHLFWRGFAVLDRREGDLFEHRLETWSPLAGPESRGGRAVVDHVRDSTRMHVREQGVDSLDDRLVRDLRVRVTVLYEDVDLGHHRPGEGAGRE